MTNGDLGPEILRHRFPVGVARVFVFGFFGLLLLLPAYIGVQVAMTSGEDPSAASVGYTVAATFAAMILIGFIVALLVLRRRPTELRLFQRALVLRYGRREQLVGWDDVIGLDQVRSRAGPSHVVLFRDGKRLAFGLGKDAQTVARQIAECANLTWVEEPFRATRR
jgi:hypothetical protein